MDDLSPGKQFLLAFLVVLLIVLIFRLVYILLRPQFTSGVSKDTGYNDGGSGNTIYLDRHNVNCDTNAIKRFQLVRNGNGDIRYDYTCSAGGDLQSSVNKDTGFNDDGGGRVIYLDRHDVNCGDNAALAQFQLAGSGKGTYRYNYQCKPSKQPLTCRDVTTNASTWGDGSRGMEFLDRHNVVCNDDEVLNRIHLTRPDANTIQYQYKCCKY